LVVDDNPDYRLLVRYAVEGHGAIDLVGEAGDGPTGIELAATLQPDLILVDVLLPGMDGIAAVPLLRDAAPNAAVVAVSAYPEHQLWGRLPAAATVPYISKDLPISELPDELLRLSGRSEPAGARLATASRRFPADLQSARAARRFVRDSLVAWGCDGLLDAVELLVSELVTNAVVHARSDVELTISLRDDRVRVEVIDSTDVHVQRRDAAGESQSGRGMALIEALALAWGIDTLVAGKAVWFEVGRDPEVASA
jgi:CheY-like chemotaxis protein